MKFGADRKRIVILAGLLVLLLGVFYYNSSSTPEQTPSPRPSARNISRDTTPVPGAIPTAPIRTSRTKGTRVSQGDTRPSLKPKPGAPPISPDTDPTLAVELLAKIQAVKPIEGGRNIFDMGQAPAPKTDITKPDPGKIIPGKGATYLYSKRIGPELPPKPTPPPPPPPPPPITLKFYGFVHDPKGGKAKQKRAFFLDGEDILVGGENDMLNARYKVIRIGVNSAEIEDEQYHHRQTIPLTEEPSMGQAMFPNGQGRGSNG